MRIRVVVADRAEAAMYDIAKRDEVLRPVARLVDPLAHLHDRDLKSDRPGRVYNHAAGSLRRRGASAHHATGGERSPRKHEAALFARHIGAALEEAGRTKQFDRLVLMAGPAFLGVLRAELPDAVRERIVAEVPKDLTHEPPTSVREHLPEEVFHVPVQAE